MGLSRIRPRATVVREAAVVAFADYRATYSLRTWAGGMLVRWLAQVTFWALVGRLLRSPGAVEFILVGNAVFLAASPVMLAVASTTWERRAGTLALLAASPTGVVLPMMGRSVQWMVDAMVSSVGTLLIIGFVFGVDLPFGRVAAVLPVLAATTLATYGLALFLGALVIPWMGARNLVSSLAVGTMSVVAGVNVPRHALPGWAAAVATALPLTWGLEAARRVLRGAGLAGAAPGLIRLALTGAFWFTAAAVALGRLTEHGRRQGSLELEP